MELWFLVIINILCILAILGYFYEEFVVVKMGAMSVAMFTSLFSVVSGIFFLVDKYNFYYVLFTQLVIESIVLLFFFIRTGKRKIQFSFLLERDGIVLFIVFFAFVLTLTKFELFGANQDQGLYQAEALELYMGNYEVQHDFVEYTVLETDEQREAYCYMLDNVWIGYYRLHADNSINNIDIASEVSGMYHGVQTFPAMLALMGLLFGMSQMIHLQTVFYICCTILIYYTLCEMNISRNRRIFYSLIFVLSPLSLWISKGTYTEMFLSMMVCLYLLILMEKGEKKWLMCMSLLGFSFVHISYLVMWMGFWIANAIMYIYVRNKQYIYASIVGSMGLFIGYYVMNKIAPGYFDHNISRLYIENIVTQDNIMMWIFIIVLLSIILSCLMLKGKLEWINNILVGIQKSKWIIPLFLLMACAFWMFWGYRTGYMLESNRADRLYYGSGLMAYTHLSIYACAMATGFVILPCILSSLFIKARKIVDDAKKYVLIFIFLYFVVFLSIIYIREIHFYYYYSRYVMYTIPIVCVCAPLCINSWKKRAMIPLAAVALMSMFYFDISIITDKDDTIYEWEVLEDLKQIVEADSAIIINGENLQVVMGPHIRTVVDGAIYPVFENTRQQVEMLQKNYKNVYLLSENDIFQNEWNGGTLEVVYKDQYSYSREQALDWGLYPTNINSIRKDIILYEVSLYELEDFIWFATEERNAEKYVINGLAVDEGSFAWTNGESLVMRLGVAQEVVGSMVRATFEVQNVYNSSQEVHVYIDNELVDIVTIEDTGMLEFDFVVEDKEINIELLFPDAISPYELGMSEDRRMLALALYRATLTEIILNPME